MASVSGTSPGSASSAKKAPAKTVARKPSARTSSTKPVGPALTVDRLVRTAITLGAETGFHTLGMRALARELGVTPMALYHHVEDKSALMVLIVDHILEQVRVPGPEVGTWKDQLRVLTNRSTEAMASAPGINQVMFDLPPTTQGWRLIDANLAILLSAGFTEEQAVLGFSALHSYGMGRSAMETALRGVPPRDSPEWESSTVPRHVDLPHPALTRVHTHWSELHTADYRKFALDVIIEGLAALLDPDEQR
jgi:AcrR family transcriptional regulator